MRGKAVEAAQYEYGTPIRSLGIVERQVRDAAQQGGDCYFRFDAGELSAKAEMDAAPKRHRPDVLARDVEPIRIGIDGWITIGGAKKAHNLPALPDDGTANADLFERCAACDLDRRIVAQEFVDRSLKNRIALEQLELAGIAMKRQEGIPDQIDCGLVAGAKQEDEVRSQFFV